MLKSSPGDGIIRRDGNCYVLKLVRVQSWSSITGQLEFSSWQLNPGGSGGGTPFTPKPIKTTPIILDWFKRKECEKINDHMNSAFNLRDKVANLATKINETNERGFGMTQNNATIEFNDNLENGNIVFTSAPGVISNALCHTHTTGKLSVFSFADLVGIAQYIRRGHINAQTNNFIATLSTEKRTHYVLTISNMAKFKSFFYYKTTVLGQIWGTPEEITYKQSLDKAKEISEKYYNEVNGKILAQNANNELILKEFLKFMNEVDLGVSLFETDGTFQSFSKVSLTSSGNIKKEPCDN